MDLPVSILQHLHLILLLLQHLQNQELLLQEAAVRLMPSIILLHYLLLLFNLFQLRQHHIRQIVSQGILHLQRD